MLPIRILQKGRRTNGKEFGRLDMLVNNAAFQEHVEKFEDLSDEHFDRTLKTNLYGYFYMAQAAVARMKPGSAIVMTGSVTGLLGKQGPARLLDDEGRYSCVRALSGNPFGRQRDQGECGSARTRMDASESGRQASEARLANSARIRR